MPPPLCQATFEDSLLEEAQAKKHCTTREAVEAGAAAGAYRTLLTHSPWWTKTSRCGGVMPELRSTPAIHFGGSACAGTCPPSAWLMGCQPV